MKQIQDLRSFGFYELGVNEMLEN